MMIFSTALTEGERMPRNSLVLILLSHLLVIRTAYSEVPVVHDDQLQLTLVAEHPDIMTPIGMVVDKHDRLFVI